MIEVYKSDIDKFKRNPVWRTMKEELEGSVANMQVMLMSLDPFAQATELSRTQGRMEAVKAFMEMPDDIYADALEEKEKKEEEKENARTSE